MGPPLGGPLFPPIFPSIILAPTLEKPKENQGFEPLGGLGGRPEFSIFFQFFFGAQIGLELCPRALGGPGGVLGLFWGPGGALGANLFSPYFPLIFPSMLL